MQGVGSFATHHSCCHLWEIKELRRLHTDEELNWRQYTCNSNVAARQAIELFKAASGGQISKKRLMAA